MESWDVLLDIFELKALIGDLINRARDYFITFRDWAACHILPVRNPPVFPLLPMQGSKNSGNPFD